jgi:hypothetical protein
MGTMCEEIWPDLAESIKLLRQSEQSLKEAKLRLVKAARIIGAHEQFSIIDSHSKAVEILELNVGYQAKMVEATLSSMQAPEHTVEIEQG